MSGVTPYSAIDDYTLSVIKAPPLDPIIVEGAAGVAPRSSNDIQGHVFQFTYRYIYADEERSVWGIPTFINAAHFSYGNANIYDLVLSRGGLFAEMNFGFSLGFGQKTDLPTGVIKIEIAVRIDGGAWYYLDTIERPFAANIVYYFYNDKTLIQLADGEITTPYDYVPKLARCQEIINKNIICYGDVLEGYNNPQDIDIRLWTDIKPVDDFHLYLPQQLPVSATSTTSSTTSTTSPGDYSPYNMWNTITNAHIYHVDHNTIDVVWPATTPTRSNFVLYLIGNQTYHSIAYNMCDDWGAASATVFATIIADDPWVTSANVIGGTTTIRIVFAVDSQFFGAVGLRYGNFKPVFSVKDSTKYNIGIEYLDKFGRVGTVVHDETMIVEVPSLNGVVYYNDYISQIKYEINHTPPIWAEKWRFCYNSNVLWWMQYLIRPYHEVDRSVFRNEDDNLLKIKINEGVNNVRDELKDYALDNYVWEKGDRIRIIGTVKIREDDVTHFPVELNNVTYKEIDYEIQRFDGIYIYITDFTSDDQVVAWWTPPDIDSADADDILVEIYRLKKDTDNIIYKSIPEVHDILNPGKSIRSHDDAIGIIGINNEVLTMLPVANLVADRFEESESGGTTSSTSTTTSNTTTYIWDAPFAPGLKCCLVHIPYFEHKLNSQFEYLWDSKINISDPNAKEIRVNKLRWGGQYIDDATVNNVCRFLYDDQLRMPDKYGFIYGMREVGYTLKVLQQSKNTSIYIGREETVNADGSVSYVYVNSLFGNIAPHIEEFGTVFPDSIVISDRYMYFFDIYSGRVIRDAPNGMLDIGFGQFKMQTYFRQKADALLSSGVSNIKVLGSVDRENNMVYFTFIDSVNSQNDETIGFHELSGRWKSFYSFIPECYGKLGENTFFSFENGRPYIHNSDMVNRCVFYGSPYANEIWLVSNINPAMIKQFNSITIVSNEPWVLDGTGDVYIPPSTTYPNGMQSKLRATDFEEYEGEFRAAFLGDMLTAGVPPSDYYLYTGRQLKGRTVLLKLSNAETGEVNLFIVKVKSSVSK